MGSFRRSSFARKRLICVDLVIDWLLPNRHKPEGHSLSEHDFIELLEKLGHEVVCQEVRFESDEGDSLDCGIWETDPAVVQQALVDD